MASVFLQEKYHRDMSEIESEMKALDFLKSTGCRAVIFDMDGVLADITTKVRWCFTTTASKVPR